jgi:hypothetical protein
VSRNACFFKEVCAATQSTITLLKSLARLTCTNSGCDQATITIEVHLYELYKSTASIITDRARVSKRFEYRIRTHHLRHNLTVIRETVAEVWVDGGAAIAIYFITNFVVSVFPES